MTDTTAAPGRHPLERLAWFALAAHAAFSLFSAFAFATFLSGPPPAWLLTPANQQVMQVAMAFGPATTVVLGALAGLLHASGRLGARTALLVFVPAFVISLGAELLGTSTGFPFGPYSYTPLLGYRVLDLVPFNIPTSWFYMLYGSLAICGRLLSPTDDAASKMRWAVAAGVILTAWDVSMDPAMVSTDHWRWHLGDPATQGAATRLLLGDLFYGMPLSNWLGWLLTGTVVARVMLAVVPPSSWARLVAPARLPLVLYAVNGVLPIAICARRDMPWAAGLGALAMFLPLALAVRAGRRARSAAPARPASPRGLAVAAE